MSITDGELRQAFAVVTVLTDRRPTAEEIMQLVDGDGDDRSRMETLDRLMSSPEGMKELSMVRALRAGFHSDAAAPSASQQRNAFAARATLMASAWGLAAAVLLATFVGIGQLRDRGEDRVMRTGPALVTLVTPVDGATQTDGLPFAWRRNGGATYELEVYTATGHPIVRRETSDTTITLTSGTIPAGDHRWWVTARLDDGTQVRSATRRLVVR